MQETWYVMEDGSSADPNEVSPDETGALRHADGRAVAMKGSVPHTRGVYPDEERAVAAKPSPKSKKEITSDKDEPKKETKEIISEGEKKTYQTRETESD